MDLFPPASSESAEHLRRVQTLTDAALAHLTVESLLDELLTRIRQLLRADTAAVLLLDEPNAELVATAAKGIEEEVEQGVRLPVGGGFAGKIAATGKPVILDRVDHGKVLNPLLLKRGIRSMLGVPLVVGGRVTGVLHVGTLVPRKFTSSDIELLQLVADRLALAVRARSEQEHRVIAQTLQRSLLPDRFPHVEGVAIAGHYSPARGGMVGGDWYDVFLIGLDQLCVVVGDIAGHGAPAAIAMARLRNAVRAMVFLDEAPAKTLSRLNDFLMHFDPGVMATMLLGIISPDGTMRYANAGHMPPVYVDGHGKGQVIEGSAEPPLGGVDFINYRERLLNLEPRSRLVLYTDGLVERRGRPLEVGLEALRAAAETDWTTLETLKHRVLEGGAGADQNDDDLAILSLSFGSQEADELHTTLEADPRELATLRRTFRRWLADAKADPQQTQDILVAVGEAVTNSIEHAHGPGRGLIQVTGVNTDGLLEITVRDRGAWREPRGEHRGLGRSVMRQLMDDVKISTDENGTVVTMHKRLR
ncbi:MAG TPA: SpoIIE family protein phosphatase [Actinomycetota bacterium]|nr:SpoIIE family protein phosphatase [Actinomycetota bacterium]